MTNTVHPTNIDQTVATRWLSHSLGQGDVISPKALEVIREHKGHIYALAPAATDPARLMKPSEGGITGQHAAREALADVLATLAKHGASCVVVEDELRLKRDSKPSLDGLLQTGFVDERVVHWATLADGTDATILTLGRGSGGYPLNAFVSSASEQELGLIDGADISHDIASSVVRSLLAVIVSAYDDETFMIWEPTAGG